MQEYFDFAITHWELSFALIITLLMLGWNIFGYKIQGYTPVSPEQAVPIINQQDAVILDVREQKELEQTGKISDAHHIPLGNLSKSDASALGGDTSKPIIVVCRTGNRSAMACGRLKKLGFINVYNLKGGVTSWHKSGFPLVKT